MEENKEVKEKRKGVGRNGNLIPASMRSKDEVRELGRKGGIKAQEINTQRRNAQEIMQTLLYQKIDVAQATEKLGDMAKFLPEGATLFDMISLVQILNSGEGSAKAFEVVRDTAGFKPVERQEITADIMTDADKALLEKVSRRVGVDPDKLPKK